jgi:hypothetical protein
MASIESRINQIERQLGQAECVCSERAQQPALVVVNDGWGPEQIERAEGSVRFTCPIHGDRSPPILRVSEADAKL